MTKKGFSLIELIVAMAILAIVTSSLLGSFSRSQARARDAQRKSDLKQVQNALEAYFNDYVGYPTDTSGKINNISWGGEFSDTQGTIYMKALPQDPKTDKNYYYVQTQSGKSYRLYACLENDQDICFNTGSSNCNSNGFSGTSCGQCWSGTCNYGAISSNESL